MTDEKLRELIDRALEGVKVNSVQVQTEPKRTTEATGTWVHYEATKKRTITIEVEEGV